MTKKEIDALKYLYELRDWDIKILFSDARLTEELGQVEYDRTERVARIDVYPEKHDARYNEVETLEHELCEVYLNGEIFDGVDITSDMERRIDRAADWVRRVAKRAYAAGKRDAAKQKPKAAKKRKRPHNV